MVTESNVDNMQFDDEYPDALSDSEQEDGPYLVPHPDDLPLLTAKIEKNFSSLELYHYTPETELLQIHHDIMLASFPVCLEWMCAQPSSTEGNVAAKGSIAVVGLLTPEIELWDLSAFEPEGPLVTLGGKQGHKDAVTSLAVHPSRINILLSSSAD